MKNLTIYVGENKNHKYLKAMNNIIHIKITEYSKYCFEVYSLSCQALAFVSVFLKLSFCFCCCYCCYKLFIFSLHLKHVIFIPTIKRIAAVQNISLLAQGVEKHS